jgi:hypothetical protein
MHYAERVKNEYPEYDVRVTILVTYKEVEALRHTTVFWPVV